ncbi:unnamed protein product [Trichobilharzia regenti]|nr:unnamed protein product [Trichobilharzia regenti]
MEFSHLKIFFCFYFRNRLPHLIGQPELRIFEMNKRLQQRSDDCDSLWWESFATDFFEDDATLTLAFLTEEGPKSYTIGRTLIPRYFRSIFESGCGELYYNLRLNHEYFHHPILTLDSESATMTMTMVRSIPVTVVVEGRLTLDFAFDDLMRIRSWIFLIRTDIRMPINHYIHRGIYLLPVMNKILSAARSTGFVKCVRNSHQESVTETSSHVLHGANCCIY